MTTKVEKDDKLEEKFDPSEYSCEILLEKTTSEKSIDRKFINNRAYLILVYGLVERDL